jgi:DNA processing protein
MIKEVDFHIKELELMKKYPEYIGYIGNINLLKKRKVSIVGSRKPNQYAKNIISKLSSKLSSNNICIVSGGAMGIDIIAHKYADKNTIMVAGTGLDKKYPAINKSMIEYMQDNALVISQFREQTNSFKYNFPIRNELVVSLGECLIVGYSDINSGTIRSVEYALRMKKDIYVLPHRIGESNGTNKLLEQNKAKAIYDIDEFIYSITGKINNTIEDEFLQYCSNNPTYEDACKKYSEKVFEYEILGKIHVKNGIVSNV